MGVRTKFEGQRLELEREAPTATIVIGLLVAGQIYVLNRVDVIFYALRSSKVEAFIDDSAGNDRASDLYLFPEIAAIRFIEASETI